MEFRCHDLHDAGVVLVPPDSAAFRPLLADIERHLNSPPEGSPPPLPGDELVNLLETDNPFGVILWNQSPHPICARSVIWRYEEFPDGPRSRVNLPPGRQSGSVITPGFPSLLLPFGLTDERRPFVTYWHTILPNSKRYIERSAMLGTNADVRPPAAEERWKGGVMRWGGGRKEHPVEHLKSVTVILDGIFFGNGEFAGPDEMQLWDRVICDAEIYSDIAAVASAEFHAGTEAGRILDRIEEITGRAEGAPPPPPPPPGDKADPEVFRLHTRWHVARTIAHRRAHLGNEGVVSMLRSWAGAILPEYRRLP